MANPATAAQAASSPDSARQAGERPGVVHFTAWRGLRESLLSTALTVVAVAVGIGFEIPSVANLCGYRAEPLAQSLDGGGGDVRVHPLRGA